MQRLSIEIVERMCRSHLTRCQIDFLLGISRYQDETGKVTGVYYKDIALEMGFSVPQFYAAKRELEEKGFITCEKNNYYDHDITIQGNNYFDIYQNPERNLKEKPYINTRHAIFYDKGFQHLKPGAKLLAMLFMGVSRLNHGVYKIKVQNFFENFKKKLGVKERILRVYITQLKEFFSIGIVKGVYYIRPKKYKVYHQKGSGKSEIDSYNEHQIEKTCRRSHVKVERRFDIEEVRKLIKQYRGKAAEAGKEILNLVLEGVRLSVDPIEDMISKESVLKPKLVHLWVKRLIGMAEGENGQEKPNTASVELKQSNKFNEFPQRKYDYDALERALLESQRKRQEACPVNP